MSQGYGSMPWGLGPYGGPPAPFNVLSATAVDYRTVDVVFSDTLGLVAAVVSAGSYSIDHGLLVLAVALQNPTTVRLFTTAQNPGVTYTVTVGPLVTNAAGQSTSVNQASFSGLAPPVAYVVSGLSARSVCTGLAIRLTWQNPLPTGPAPPAGGLGYGGGPYGEGPYGGPSAAPAPGTPEHVKVVRRLRAWPFDLSDLHDVVYDGPPIESFVDTGVAVPLTSLSATAAAGDMSITVANTVGYNMGDNLRVEMLTGPVTFDIVTVAGFGGPGVINLVAPLKNAYAFGARVAESTPLLPQTYYYYLVLVSTSVSPDDGSYDIGDESRDFALSIDSSLNSAAWLKNETPNVYLKLDAKPLSEGGGGGFLAKWFEVMGCWMNLMRGYANALALMGDPNNAPFHVLPAKNQSLGIDPEGLAYDFDIVRRPLTSLAFVYKRKGTCPGIVETVRMFTKWDARCVDFSERFCANGATTFKTWDGDSICQYGEGPVNAQIIQTVVSTDGAAQFIDLSGTFSDHLFQNGTLRGWTGDILCVSDNTGGTTFSITPPPLVTTSFAFLPSGAMSIPIIPSPYFAAGMVVQVTDTSGVAPFNAEIVQLRAALPGVLTLTGPGLKHSYPPGAMISIGKSIARTEYAGSTSTVAAGFSLIDTHATWVQNQWTGYVLLDSSNTLHNVVSNQGNNVTVDGAAPSAGAYSVAHGFILGGSFATRTPILKYKASNGVHADFFEPTYDLTLRGTRYDPASRLFDGVGLNLAGVFGPGDVGVYILGNVPVAVGRSSTVSSAIFTLDPAQPAPAPGEYEGLFLNPNQNQTQLFEIRSNDSTTVTVAGDVSSLVSPGQFYVILKPRDKIRFQRLSERLSLEFADVDSKIHVLFV